MSGARFRVDLDRVAWRRSGDDVVVIDVEFGDVVLLEGPASLLWVSLVDGASVAELGAAIVEHYDVDRAVATDDAAAFVDDLLTRGFVVAA